MHGRRKHVTQSKVDDFQWPKAGCHIVRALGSRGDNLFEVYFVDGTSSLVLLPAKFNKKLWIGKGSYLIVEQNRSSTDKDRITGSIDRVLHEGDVKELMKQGLWPVEFARKDPEPRNEAHIHVKTADSSEEEDDMSPLHPNNNRPSIIYNMSDDESED